MLKFILPIALLIAALLFFQHDSAVIISESTPPETALSFIPPAEVMPPSLHNSLTKDDAITDANAPLSLDPQAIESLRQARLHGDDRTPGLNKSRARDELPTPQQLADPELYQAYERRQDLKVYRAYVEAAKLKTSTLRNMIEKGKNAGISAEEIQFAEDKIKGIEEMAAQLQRDYPEAMGDDFKPADDWLIDNLGLSDPEKPGQSDNPAN